VSGKNGRITAPFPYLKYSQASEITHVFSNQRGDGRQEEEEIKTKKKEK
jgi:hypothetical protein